MITSNSKQGKFVVIDGPNGSGKTTLINNLAKNGYKTFTSPSGTPLAEILRAPCRGVDCWSDIDKKIQFMLFSAARYDEYVRLVQPSHGIICADRWWTSTYVYQCMLGGISVDFLEHTIHPKEHIDLVVLLSAEPDVLAKRVEDDRKNTTHGTCSWTRDNETLKIVHNLYTEALPRYLKQKNIPYSHIDTTQATPSMISESVMRILKEQLI